MSCLSKCKKVIQTIFSIVADVFDSFCMFFCAYTATKKSCLIKLFPFYWRNIAIHFPCIEPKNLSEFIIIARKHRKYAAIYFLMQKWRRVNREYKEACSISTVCRNCQDIDNFDNCEWKRFLRIYLECMLGCGWDCNHEERIVSDSHRKTSRYVCLLD